MAGQAGQDEGDFEWGDNAVGGSEDRAQLLASVTAVEHGLAQQNQDTKASADQGGILASALTCCSVDSLKPYFDPATDAVVKQRILLAVAAPIYLRPGNGQEGFLGKFLVRFCGVLRGTPTNFVQRCLIFQKVLQRTCMDLFGSLSHSASCLLLQAMSIDGEGDSKVIST
jgi:hypothetical protein